MSKIGGEQIGDFESLLIEDIFVIRSGVCYKPQQTTNFFYFQFYFFPLAFLVAEVAALSNSDQKGKYFVLQESIDRRE